VADRPLALPVVLTCVLSCRCRVSACRSCSVLAARRSPLLGHTRFGSLPVRKRWTVRLPQPGQWRFLSWLSASSAIQQAGAEFAPVRFEAWRGPYFRSTRAALPTQCRALQSRRAFRSSSRWRRMRIAPVRCRARSQPAP